VPSGPAAAHPTPTVNQLLDHWLATSKPRARSRFGRLAATANSTITSAHTLVRCRSATCPPCRSSACTTTWPTRAARTARPAGCTRTIRELHHCLHQALTHARRWHHLPANPADDAEPPALPTTESVSALTPEQVGHLLAAAQQDPRPWLRAFVVLAAATGARNGELCGLEWHDLDLEAGTIRFRQALSSVDQQLATSHPRPDGRHGKLLVVGPLKTPASQAVLCLPAFAVAALRDDQHQQHQQPRTRTADGRRVRPRLLHAQPGQPPRPVELDLVLRTQWGTPLRPNHASRSFRAFAQATGIAAHPHLLRHSLASALAAAKEPASVIAEQLRHADGGTLASRTYIHRLPQTAPRLARHIQAVYGPAATQARTGDRSDRNR
jgi:integrase